MSRASNRREILGLLGASLLPIPALAQGSLLPVNTPGLDHLDVIVPDVEKTARFYMGLFRTSLHAQPFQGAQRYFVLLGDLPENRAVGYIAIGASRGRGTYIGHFCTSVVEWRRDSAAIFAQMKERFGAAGFGTFPGASGAGGIFDDPDGIEIQFLPAPDTVVTAAIPSELVPWNRGLVTPKRVEYMLLKVSNLDRAVAFYNVLYGKEARRNADSAAFVFRNGTRLELEATRYTFGNAQTRIARYGIRVDAFDRTATTAGIATLGGSLVSDDGRVLRLRDADGIELDLVSG